jgi:hypothetical protein
MTNYPLYVATKHLFIMVELGSICQKLHSLRISTSDKIREFAFGFLLIRTCKILWCISQHVGLVVFFLFFSFFSLFLKQIKEAFTDRENQKQLSQHRIE